jgi:hypothetical protein
LNIGAQDGTSAMTSYPLSIHGSMLAETFAADICLLGKIEVAAVRLAFAGKSRL